MKKVLAFILSLVVIFSCTTLTFAEEKSNDFGAYKSVIILGIDGAGAFFDNTPTPNMDRIFAEDSFVTHSAMAENKTISAQNWASILMGVKYTTHKITNDIASNVERTSDEAIPTIFRLIREQKPSAKLASICNWDAINHGIIENDIGVDKQKGETDEETCQLIEKYLEKNTPELLFVQLDDVDHYGHSDGFGSKSYLESITKADEYIGRVYDVIEKKGEADDTLFIVVSDHGGKRTKNHGTRTLGEQLVYIGVKGKTVGENNTYGVRNRDVASITLYALGIEPDDGMISKVPNGLFKGYDNKENTFLDKILIMLEEATTAIVNKFADLGGKF